MDANNYFNNLRGQAKPQDRRNDFGGKIGGPVQIPHLYRGTDGILLFQLRRNAASFAGLLQYPQSPIPPFRSGNFSASPTIVTNPSSGAPFPGNQLPASLLDPAGQKILNLLPQPNSPGTYDAVNHFSVNDYVLAHSVSSPSDDYTVRIDHSFSYSTRLFGHVNWYSAVSPAGTIIPGPVDPGTGANDKNGYNAVLGLTQNFTPNMLGEFRAGFLRFSQNRGPSEPGFRCQKYFGNPESAGSDAPSISLPGWTSLGMNSNTWAVLVDNIYQLSGNGDVGEGAHVVKWGAQARRSQFNGFNPSGNFAGTFAFDGEMTAPNRATNNPINVLADFLLGKVKTASYLIPQPLNGRQDYNIGILYPGRLENPEELTFNLGLRDDYESSPVSTNGMYSRVDAVTGKTAGGRPERASEPRLPSSPEKLRSARRVGIFDRFENRGSYWIWTLSPARYSRIWAELYLTRDSPLRKHSGAWESVCHRRFRCRKECR